MEDNFFSEEELDSLKRITLEELQELAEKLGPLVKDLGLNASDAPARDAARNIFHTIGGSAALAGFEHISDLGAKLESLLKKLPADMPVPQDTLGRISAALEQLESFCESETRRMDGKSAGNQRPRKK